jgi:hypothetical protein
VPGVPERGYGCGCGENGDALLRLDESGVMGVPRDRRDLGRLDVDTPSADCLRCGVDICPGRTRDETVHERGLSEEGVGDVSVFPDKVGLIVVDSLGLFSSSPSFHCKWRITDLVAHWFGGNEWCSKKEEEDLRSFASPLPQTTAAYCSAQSLH